MPPGVKRSVICYKNLATRNILHVKDIVACTVVPPCIKILLEISAPVTDKNMNGRGHVALPIRNL